MASQTTTTTADGVVDAKDKSKSVGPRFGFLDKSSEAIESRATYFKMVGGVTVMLILILYSLFPIFWGGIWKTPVRNIHGWIVDFDGGLVGQGTIQALTAQPELSRITWDIKPASDFPGGPDDLSHSILSEKAWVGVAINSGASSALAQAIASPSASYDSSRAVTIYAVEGRNENTYRVMIMPLVQARLAIVARSASTQVLQSLASSPANLAAIANVAPQIIASPIGYTVRNLAPYDQVLTAGLTFFGLVFQSILAFILAGVSFGARLQTNLVKRLTTRSLILLRISTLFVAYFVVSLFYALLALAFQLDFTKRFGKSGFLIFWMLNYCNMLAMGLAFDSLIIIMPLPSMPFFVLMLMLTNSAINSSPIEVLPRIYRYGYAMPFYNVTRGIRVILFGTKNVVGISFGVLLGWVGLTALITIPLFQYLMRRREASQAEAALASSDDGVVQHGKISDEDKA